MQVFKSKDELKTAIKNYFKNPVFRLIDTRRQYILDNPKYNINKWDTSQITDMSRLFSNLPKISNYPITLFWDTSNVTNMSDMFLGCDQNFILHFNTSKVTNMSYMFKAALNFNNPLNFNTSNVRFADNMLNNTDNFNYPLNIDTSRIIHSLNIVHYKSYSHPFYMIDDPRKVNNDEAANKYYLSQGFYWKLIIFSILNSIDSNLLMCCDEFENYI